MAHSSGTVPVIEVGVSSGTVAVYRTSGAQAAQLQQELGQAGVGVIAERYGAATYVVLSPEQSDLDAPALDQLVRRIAGSVTLVPTLI